MFRVVDSPVNTDAAPVRADTASAASGAEVAMATAAAHPSATAPTAARGERAEDGDGKHIGTSPQRPSKGGCPEVHVAARGWRRL